MLPRPPECIGVGMAGDSRHVLVPLHHQGVIRRVRGVSLQEVVRTVHMKLHLAKLQHQVVDVRVGLGEGGHQATHREGFSYALPVGP